MVWTCAEKGQQTYWTKDVEDLGRLQTIHGCSEGGHGVTEEEAKNRVRCWLLWQHLKGAVERR